MAKSWDWNYCREDYCNVWVLEKEPYEFYIVSGIFPSTKANEYGKANIIQKTQLKYFDLFDFTKSSYINIREIIFGISQIYFTPRGQYS